MTPAKRPFRILVIEDNSTDVGLIKEGLSDNGIEHEIGCFPSPLIKPDVPISSIRLSDRLRQRPTDRGPRCTSRRHSTPSSPNTRV